jgi:hypothetical protein
MLCKCIVCTTIIWKLKAASIGSCIYMDRKEQIPWHQMASLWDRYVFNKICETPSIDKSGDCTGIPFKTDSSMLRSHFGFLDNLPLSLSLCATSLFYAYLSTALDLAAATRLSAWRNDN